MPVDVRDTTITAPPQPLEGRRTTLLFLAGLVVVALCLAAYALGSSRPHESLRSGVPHVGINVVTWQIGDTYYGFHDGGVHWTDSDGVLQDRGWPACLRQDTTSVVPFSTVKVTYNGERATDQVVWVDCR
jgi:hypothetical protein